MPSRRCRCAISARDPRQSRCRKSCGHRSILESTLGRRVERYGGGSAASSAPTTAPPDPARPRQSDMPRIDAVCSASGPGNPCPPATHALRGACLARFGPRPSSGTVRREQYAISSRSPGVGCGIHILQQHHVPMSRVLRVQAAINVILRIFVNCRLQHASVNCGQQHN